jgi:hypothetical protein
MNKMNPNQVDLFQAAIGQDDVTYAQNICKKLGKKAVKKAIEKTLVKDEMEFQDSQAQIRGKTETGNHNDYFD